MQKKKITKKGIGVPLIAIAVVFLAVLAIRRLGSTETDTPKVLPELLQAEDSYGKYLNQYENAAYPDTKIVIFGGEFIEASEGFEKLDDYEELGNSCALTLEG